MRDRGMHVVRVYEVVLSPSQGVTITADGAKLVSLSDDDAIFYDPFIVTLSYRPEVAAKLDPRSPEAIAEAARRAIKVERRDNETTCDLAAASVEFKRQRLVTA